MLFQQIQNLIWKAVAEAAAYTGKAMLKNQHCRSRTCMIRRDEGALFRTLSHRVSVQIGVELYRRRYLPAETPCGEHKRGASKKWSSTEMMNRCREVDYGPNIVL